MCGRYWIYEPMDHYLKELAQKQLVINGYDLGLSSGTTSRRPHGSRSFALLEMLWASTECAGVGLLFGQKANVQTR